MRDRKTGRVFVSVLLSSLLFAGVSGCANAPRAESHSSIPSRKGEVITETLVVKNRIHETMVPMPPPEVTVAPASPSVQETGVARHSFSGHQGLKAPVSRDETMAELVRGNERFAQSRFLERDLNAAKSSLLSKRKSPHTIVLSCSDSSLPPELLLDQAAGELLVLQSAGQVPGAGQVAGIERAVEQYDVKLILVLGHESCGVVRAALLNEPARIGVDGVSTDQNWLLGEVRPSVTLARIPASIALSADPKLRRQSMSHVDAVSEQLILRSALLRGRIETGKLRLVRGIARESGQIDFWGLGTPGR